MPVGLEDVVGRVMTPFRPENVMDCLGNGGEYRGCVCSGHASQPLEVCWGSRNKTHTCSAVKGLRVAAESRGETHIAPEAPGREKSPTCVPRDSLEVFSRGMELQEARRVTAEHYPGKATVPRQTKKTRRAFQGWTSSLRKNHLSFRPLQEAQHC